MTTLYHDALAMLKRLRSADLGVCPLCSCGEVCDADCELMALIKKMESTPMHCRPVGTADLVQQAEHARGTCPECGFYNHPEANVRDADDGLVFCNNCGSTWTQ